MKAQLNNHFWITHNDNGSHRKEVILAGLKLKKQFKLHDIQLAVSTFVGLLKIYNFIIAVRPAE